MKYFNCEWGGEKTLMPGNLKDVLFKNLFIALLGILVPFMKKAVIFVFGEDSEYFFGGQVKSIRFSNVFLGE